MRNAILQISKVIVKFFGNVVYQGFSEFRPLSASGLKNMSFQTSPHHQLAARGSRPAQRILMNSENARV